MGPVAKDSNLILLIAIPVIIVELLECSGQNGWSSDIVRIQNQANSSRFTIKAQIRKNFGTPLQKKI